MCRRVVVAHKERPFRPFGRRLDSYPPPIIALPVLEGDVRSSDSFSSWRMTFFSPTPLRTGR